MRLFESRDALLLGGLTAALIIVFASPISRLFDYIGEIERQTGLTLLPALVILMGVFIFHLMRKRHAMQSQAAVAEVAKREAERRTSEIQRLVAFGHAVARALDHDAIRSAISQHLPRVAGTEDVWVLLRQGMRWEVLSGDVKNVKTVTDREEFAERLVSGDHVPKPGDYRAGFPLIVGGKAAGVLGVFPTARLDEDRQRAIEAAASLIAVSLKNVQLFREVRETGVRDVLTGCWTRSHAVEVIDGELRRAKRSQLPMSLILFDLDHFKGINDKYGHLCGDAVLAAIGKRMHEVLRGSDLKCRWGGEEFLVVLPDTPLHGAGCVAETLRRAIADQPVSWGGEALSISASLGVSQALPGEINIEAVVGRADAALYRAKQQGRNRVRLEPDGPPPPPDVRKPEDGVEAATPALGLVSQE
jgi:diguanylate cyclase (GGDEF)-like protein